MTVQPPVKPHPEDLSGILERAFYEVSQLTDPSDGSEFWTRVADHPLVTEYIEGVDSDAYDAGLNA